MNVNSEGGSSRKRKPIYYPIEENKMRKQISELRKANKQLIEKEQMYIDKLIKLEGGLLNQNKQLEQLHHLYQQLLTKYRLKEQEVFRLQILFRDTQAHSRILSASSDPSHNLQYQTLQKQYAKLLADRQRLKKQLEGVSYQHIENSNRLMHESKLTLQGQQKDSVLTQQTNIKYQNQYFKQRNMDLQKVNSQLQQLLRQQQKQITKLRQQKIMIRLQYSNKMNKSVSPSKTKNYQLTNRSSFYQNLKKHNEDIIESIHKSNLEYTSGKQIPISKFELNSQRHNKKIDYDNMIYDEMLPSFPAELEIDSLISKHNRLFKEDK